MNANEPCNVEITFSDGRAVVIENLTHTQQNQLSEMLEASAAWYRWRAWHVGRPTISDKIDAAWRRLNAWMAPLLFVALLPVAAMAQKAIEPVRVKVSGPADSASAELVSSVRAELRSLRDVALVESRVDFEIQLNAKRINSGECRGVTAAVLVVRRADSLHALDVYVGGDFQQLAKFLVETLNAENFTGFRANALQRRK